MNATPDDSNRSAYRLGLDTAQRPLPALLMTVDDVAALFQTSKKAIYSKVDRGQLPGVTKIGRRLYFHREVLLHWLSQKCAPSPKEM